METQILNSTSSASTTSVAPIATEPDTTVTVRNASPAIAFLIGLSIVILASILNAAGLNLTKLDHVRTQTIPKGLRRRDWLRPLWIVGMLLYILSQLIGSTLALEYMRAEYVAPLGSTSLIFNFLFANALVGTPVTSTDIYGTAVVILGVVGIVAFGSINSGLATETDANHLSHLWARGGWIGYFIVMCCVLFALLVCIVQLDAILVARSDLEAVPFAAAGGARSSPPTGRLARMRGAWVTVITWIRVRLELWTSAHDDKQIAWTLGIAWACAGGGLAGGCLVFAKATVKLLSGSISHENSGNQFGHVAPIVTLIVLAVTAVGQIVCLNKGLAVYDSTLVVPVFYGVYTATGFLNSLVFNDFIDAYASWALFLIFVSILILISGVVLLTHKKPEPKPKQQSNSIPLSTRRKTDKGDKVSSRPEDDGDDGENAMLHAAESGQGEQVVWDVGEASDDEEDGGARLSPGPRKDGPVQSPLTAGPEGRGLMENEDEDDLEERPTSLNRPGSSSMQPFRDDDEFR